MSLVILVEPLVSSCLVLCLEPLCRWPPVGAVSFAARTTAPSGEARCERLLLTGEFHWREGISDHPRHSRRPSGYEKLSEAIMVTMVGAMVMGVAAFECLLTGSGKPGSLLRPPSPSSHSPVFGAHPALLLYGNFAPVLSRASSALALSSEHLKSS